MTTASSTLLIIAASGTFAPLMSAASGTPRPSVKICLFTPLFARSVGFGPVRSPLLAPSPRRCRVSSTSTRCRDVRRSSSAARGESPRIHRAAPTSESAGDTSTLSRSRSVAPSTDNPFSDDRGCQPSLLALPPADGRPSALRARPESTARSVATGHRVRRRTWLPRMAVDHTRSARSRGFRIGCKPLTDLSLGWCRPGSHCRPRAREDLLRRRQASTPQARALQRSHSESGRQAHYRGCHQH
jgi:hypothetical protein